MGVALILFNSPWAPKTHLEQGDLFAMALLGLVSALAFQCTAAMARFTVALRDALVASITILLRCLRRRAVLNQRGPGTRSSATELSANHDDDTDDGH